MKKYKAAMKPLEVMQRLGQAKTTKAQSKIIKDAWTTNSEEFFIGVSISIDPTMNFKLVSVPEIQDEDDGSPGELTFKQFYQLTMKLTREDLSESEIKNAVTEAALCANITEWNQWYRRILLKTLPKYLPMDTIKNTLSELTQF